MITEIKCREEILELDKLEPHTLLRYFGLDATKEIENRMPIYIRESKVFNFYDSILVLEPNIILSNVHSWRALMENNVKKYCCCILEGLQEGDILRAISGSSVFFNKNYIGKAALISQWRNYLCSESGKIFSMDIPGDKTVEKISYLTGFSISTIKIYLSIVKYNSAALDDIGDEEHQRTLMDAYEESQKIKLENEGIINPISEKDGIDIVNKAESIESVEKNKKNKKSRVNYIPEFYDISYSDGTPTLTFQGNKSIILKKCEPTITQNKLTYNFETEDSQTKLQITLINPRHIYDIT